MTVPAVQYLLSFMLIKRLHRVGVSIVVSLTNDMLPLNDWSIRLYGEK
jgi:hypothetical protein